jgi:hypothetical protein
MKSTLICVVSTTFILMAVAVQLAAQEPAKHHHYKLIDLGTFGGPNSGVSGGPPEERLLSKQGTVVGTAETPYSDPFAPNCIFDCFVIHAFVCKMGSLRIWAQCRVQEMAASRTR